MTLLPPPRPGRAAAEEYVARHLGHLTRDEVRGSQSFSGGQATADAALAAFDVSGYAQPPQRGVPDLATRCVSFVAVHPSRPSHAARGLGPSGIGGRSAMSRSSATNCFGRNSRATGTLGSAPRTRQGTRHDLEVSADVGAGEGWSRQLACLDGALNELEDDGWLVNQTRMWLAGHWTVREGLSWMDGENLFFAHLLDGSRAANRLGWQWVTGAGSSKPYGLSRRQVERRAPGVCASCELRNSCPIEQWPSDPIVEPVVRVDLMRLDPTPDLTAGPREIVRDGAASAVWLTAESLGRRDPALANHPELPVVFVFDEPPVGVTPALVQASGFLNRDPG